MSEWVGSGTPCMYRLKRVGESTAPCGTASCCGRLAFVFSACVSACEKIGKSSFVVDVNDGVLYLLYE